MAIPFLRVISRSSEGCVEFLCCRRRATFEYWEGYNFCPGCGTKLQGSLVCRPPGEPAWVNRNPSFGHRYDDYLNRPKPHSKWQIEKRYMRNVGEWSNWKIDRNAYVFGNNRSSALRSLKETVYDDSYFVSDTQWRLVLETHSPSGEIRRRYFSPEWAKQKESAV